MIVRLKATICPNDTGNLMKGAFEILFHFSTGTQQWILKAPADE